MIPKIIHYCWFGKSKPSKLAKNCIKSWRKFCPDYKIILWDENSFSISSAPRYVKEAYHAKKWAFVTDYVRLWAVYNYGGVYLDTDCELIKPLDDFLIYDSFFGFESIQLDGSYFISTGLGFGSKANNELVKFLMNSYNNKRFLMDDGTYDLTTCPIFNKKTFLDYGVVFNNTLQIINNNIFLPSEYLCPTKWYNDDCSITCKTYSIQHFAHTWKNSSKRNFFKKIFDFLVKNISPITKK